MEEISCFDSPFDKYIFDHGNFTSYKWGNIPHNYLLNSKEVLHEGILSEIHAAIPEIESYYILTNDKLIKSKVCIKRMRKKVILNGL